MSQKFVACFAEGEFEVLAGPFTLDEAKAYEAGFYQGAGSYGAGTPAAYVLPDEVAEMRDDEDDVGADLAIDEYERRRMD